MLISIALMTLAAAAPPSLLPGLDTEKQASALVEQARATPADLTRALATERRTDTRVREASKIEEDVGFFGRFVPLSPDDEMHPDIDNAFSTIYIMWFFTGLFGGPLWLHTVLLDDPEVVKTEDFQQDALWFWVWTIAITAGNLVFNYAGLICGPVVFITFTLGMIFFLVRAFYLGPISYINFLNRHALANDGGGRQKKKKRRRRNSLNGLPGIERAAVAAY